MCILLVLQRMGHYISCLCSGVTSGGAPSFTAHAHPLVLYHIHGWSDFTNMLPSHIKHLETCQCALVYFCSTCASTFRHTNHRLNSSAAFRHDAQAQSNHNPSVSPKESHNIQIQTIIYYSFHLCMWCGLLLQALFMIGYSTYISINS